MSLTSTLNIIFGGKSYRKTSGYGYRIHPITKKRTFHYGVDYGCSKVPLYALEDGTIYKRGYEAGGAGNYVYVKYPRLGVAVAYFHLTSISLKQGATVRKGTQVGIAGTTGSSTGVHLHIGVRSLSTWKWQDPEAWLTKYRAPSTATVAPAYVVGRTYTLKYNVKVRTGAGVGCRQKKRTELTANGRKYALSGTYAVLKSGTKVTCQKVIYSGSDIWIKIPSGYVCAKQGSAIFIS